MSRFAFRAGAAAAGGYFTRPFNEPLPVQAASFLMPSGGYGSARVKNFRYHEIVSFDRAYTQVMGTTHGEDGKRVHETLAMAVIEGLNVLDVVTADRVVARLTSAVPGGKPSEMSALPTGSHFQNLRIAGELVAPRCHGHLLKGENATRSAIVKANAPLFAADSTRDSGPIALGREAGTLRFSVFEPVEDRIAGAAAFPGCRIRIDGFGDIYLGEYVVSADHRQLTMIRIELHSPEEGDVAFASVEGNGSVY